MLLAVTAMAALVGVSLIHGISLPLTAMSGAMRRLADGDMTIPVDGVGRKDEIGMMAGAVQVFKDNMIKADELAAAQEVERKLKE